MIFVNIIYYRVTGVLTVVFMGVVVSGVSAVLSVELSGVEESLIKFILSLLSVSFAVVYLLVELV